MIFERELPTVSCLISDLYCKMYTYHYRPPPWSAAWNNQQVNQLSQPQQMDRLSESAEHEQK